MLPAEVLIVTRWIHFVAGITWIGLLYWFNLVNVNFMKTLDAGTRPAVVPNLLPRALFWFRHSAWVTVLAGLVLIYGLYWARGDIVTSDSARTIFAGMLLGLVMLFNVWFLIWPNQRRSLAAMAAGEPPDPAWARNTLYASRTNVTLSFPMLFFMAGASHYPLGDWLQIVVVAVVLGAAALTVVLTVQKWWAARF
jgi:uncharacterized membrane protein